MLNLKRFLARLFCALLVLGALAGTIRAEDPILEREAWNVAVATGANVFTNSLTLPTLKSDPPLAVYRVTILIDGTAGTSAVIYTRRTLVGITTTPDKVVIGASTDVGQASNGALNSAVALTAGSEYAFDVTATKGVSLNFRTGTNTVFRYFLVERLVGGQP